MIVIFGTTNHAAATVLIQKPFLFVIRDRETGDIWFTGTVYKPTLWEEIADQYKSHSWEEYGL